MLIPCLIYEGKDARGVSAVNMEDLLHERVPIMKKILRITGQPGLSVGVIHQGREVFKYNLGTKDVGEYQTPNSDTLYCIASLSKAFMSASLDILVQEGKLSWDSTITSIIPEFRHVREPGMLSRMTIRDICSHRTGLESLDEITQGLDGRILIPKDKVIQVCNALPIKHDLRAGFLYNNAMYALAGHIVERTSEHSNWGEFQRERIFKPLGMNRTTPFASVHKTDDNIATPYMILTNGQRSKIAPTELSADSMNGGSGGIRSSVNDLLKWCKCLLESFNEEPEKPSFIRFNSPIFDRLTIANPQSEEKGDYQSEDMGDYCAGWCYHKTPSKLGLISPNRALMSPVIGRDSASLLVYGHQGDVPGYTCNIYIIPKTKSAIVVLSNGTGLSDATDWIAQDLIQTMHHLQPAIDFVETATQAKSKYIDQYVEQYTAPLKKNRVVGTKRPCLEDFIGSYTMEDLDIVCIDITEISSDPTRLQMKINNQKDQTLNLWYYHSVTEKRPRYYHAGNNEPSEKHFDVFCHLPESFDKCLTRGFWRDDWESTLIRFERDDEKKVTSLFWKLNGVDVVFRRG
ncbi:beta-lactamase/transpeptidase-like protein [Nemania sp. FL0031]|nr:beta-lactamase/transpeptidase-like protein [Nemania sp. FL0031]